MKYAVIILLAIISILIQLTVSPHLTLQGVIPNFFIVTVVCWVILKRYQLSFVWAAVGGIFIDLYDGDSFGLVAICSLLTALFTYGLSEKVLTSDEFYSRLGIVSLSTIFYNLAFFLILVASSFLNISNFQANLSLYYLAFLLIAMVLNMLMVIIVYPIFKAVDRVITKIDAKSTSGAKI